MSLKLVAALLHPSNEDLDDSVSPLEAKSKADDIVEAIELVTAPSEVMTAEANIDALIFAAGALGQLQESTRVTADNASEIVALSKDALSTTLPAGDIDVSLESVSIQLKHIINQIKEMIKRFFLAIARSFGFWRTRVNVMLSELEAAHALIESHYRKHRNTQINAHATANDMRWFSVYEPMKNVWSTASAPVAVLTEQTKRWLHLRQLTANTTLRAAKGVSAATNMDQIDDEIASLRGVSEEEKVRVIMSVMGGKYIASDPHGYSFVAHDPSSPKEFSELSYGIETGNLLDALKGLLELGKSLLVLESESERANGQLENYYAHIAAKAEYVGEKSILYALSVLKTATAQLFKADASFIDAFVHISKIFCRTANSVK